MLKRYFDHNATTPIAPEVARQMASMLSMFGNPSSSHSFGNEARAYLKKAKEQIAKAINCECDEIILTSGGTESNNLCLKGYLTSLPLKTGHLITTEIEHPSVFEVMKFLEREQGCPVTYLKVDKEGRINIDDLRASIRKDTVLISVMFANNEIGSIQPIEEIGAIAREHNIFFHTDAVQAMGKITVDVQKLHVDALSLSGHKFNAPKGVGILYLRKGRKISPLLHGGGQEKGIRGGTENVLATFGLGVACEVLITEPLLNRMNFKALKKHFISRVVEEIEDISFNGGTDESKFLLNTVSICINGLRAEALSSLLSEKYNIAVSLGSACSSNKVSNLSYVLKAIGLSASEIRSTIRISFGKHHNTADVDFLVAALKELTAFLRSFSTLSHPKINNLTLSSIENY